MASQAQGIALVADILYNAPNRLLTQEETMGTLGWSAVALLALILLLVLQTAAREQSGREAAAMLGRGVVAIIRLDRACPWFPPG